MTIVVGGHSRNIGKTSVVANLITALSGYSWTAIKITQFGHGVCSANGESCACATAPDHRFALTKERDASSGADTSRYLAAGAHESFWLRTRAGELGFALPALRRVLARSANVILESNSVLQFFRPDAYLVILDPANPDFKLSSQRYLDRADAFLLAGDLRGGGPWTNMTLRAVAKRAVFPLPADYRITAELREFIESKRNDACAAVSTLLKTD